MECPFCCTKVDTQNTAAKWRNLRLRVEITVQRKCNFHGCIDVVIMAQKQGRAQHSETAPNLFELWGQFHIITKMLLTLLAEHTSNFVSFDITEHSKKG